MLNIYVYTNLFSVRKPMTRSQSLGTRISNSQPLNLKFENQASPHYLAIDHRRPTDTGRLLPIIIIIIIMGTHQKIKTPVNPSKPRTNKRPVTSNKRKKQIKRRKPVSATKAGAQQLVAAAADIVMHQDTEQATSISK
jgi:hypothetical protein